MTRLYKLFINYAVYSVNPEATVASRQTEMLTVCGATERQRSNKEKKYYVEEMEILKDERERDWLHLQRGLDIMRPSFECCCHISPHGPALHRRPLLMSSGEEFSMTATVFFLLFIIFTPLPPSTHTLTDHIRRHQLLFLIDYYFISYTRWRHD